MLLDNGRNFNFNGAALFQVRKDDFLHWNPDERKRLQWGRTFSSAERGLVIF